MFETTNQKQSQHCSNSLVAPSFSATNGQSTFLCDLGFHLIPVGAAVQHPTKTSSIAYGSCFSNIIILLYGIIFMYIYIYGGCGTLV